MIIKKQISDFLIRAKEDRKDIVIGIYNIEEKKVFNVNIPYHKLQDFIISFDAIYDDDLINKAFRKFKIFAIKVFDGIDYSLKDYEPQKNKKEDNKVVTDNVGKNEKEDKEI